MPSPQPPFAVTFLGTGTSTGIPMIGCSCAVCTSPNPRNRRMRPSIVVGVATDEGRKNLLVDTTPEMRLQMLAANVERVEAVLITHTHADHIFGMDDIRQFNFRHGMRMPIYGTPPTLDHLRRVFDYCFMETQAGGGKPQLELQPIAAGEPLRLLGLDVLPLTVFHGGLPVLAFKFGARFAYVTDVSRIPDEARPHLRGLDALVIGTVRYDPHPTHFGLYQALDEIADLAPRRAYLTHLSHHFDHDRVNAELPPGVELAYDGLTLEIAGGRAGDAPA
jgi:phosphoribosyl 1,2-cyclic phosphate phosphodiesterase